MRLHCVICHESVAEGETDSGCEKESPDAYWLFMEGWMCDECGGEFHEGSEEDTPLCHEGAHLCLRASQFSSEELLRRVERHVDHGYTLDLEACVVCSGLPWTPALHSQFPEDIRMDIFRFLLVAKRLQLDLPRELLLLVASYIALS